MTNQGPNNPSVIVVKPSVSNTDTITALKSSTPASNFSMVENPILYGGSSRFILSSSCDLNQFFHLVPGGCHNGMEVEFYVFNTCFVIWFKELNRGVEMDYRSLILHAIAQVDGQDSIYLQIQGNQLANGSGDLENTVELSLTLANGGIQDESSILFKELNLCNVIQGTYNALSECTSFHLDPSSSADELDSDLYMMLEEPRPSFPIIDHSLEMLDNESVVLNINGSGVADDLGEGEEIYTDTDFNSGVVVELGVGQSRTAGTVRAREVEETDNERSKNRKL